MVAQIQARVGSSTTLKFQTSVTCPLGRPLALRTSAISGWQGWGADNGIWQVGSPTGTFSNAASDTGNGTCSAIPVTSQAIAGTYTFTAISATTFTGVDPNNNSLPDLTVGTPYSAGGVSFTVAAGTVPYAVGDTFTISVSIGGAYDGSNSANAENYPTGEDSRLCTPPITLPSLSTGTSIELGFWQWFQLGGSNQFGQYTPSADVEISVWNGTGWGNWTQLSRSITSNSNGWSFSSVDLSAYAGQRMIIAFHLNTGANSGEGWFLDDVAVNYVPDMAFNQMVSFENFTSADWQGWSADNGLWTVGTPTSGPGTALQGTNCAFAASYPTYTDSRLISPAVTLPALGASQSIVFGFWQWFQLGGSNQFGQYTPFGDVEVSTWNGTTWSGWTQLSGDVTANSNGWSYTQVDLSAYAGQRVIVAIHLNTGANTGAGWFVDNAIFTTQPDLSLNTVYGFEGATPTNTQGWWADNGLWQMGQPYGQFANSGSDTGNGSASTVFLSTSAVMGTYTFTATSSTSFTGVDPNSNSLPTLSVGSPYVGGGLSFTLQAGTTPYVMGDTFTVVAGPNGAIEGTQCAMAPFYPTYTSSHLVSPAFNVPNIASGETVSLEYWHWYQLGGSNQFGQYTPTADVEISVWNGTSWGGWTQLSENYQGSSGGWQYVGTNYSPIDITAYAGQRIQIGFNLQTGANSGDGWFIDSVRIVPPPSVASLTTTNPTIVAGSTATCTVALKYAPPTGYVPVVTTSSSPSVKVPTSVNIFANQTSNTFALTTDQSLSATTQATISATANGGTQYVSVTVVPAAVTLTISPTTVIGGVTSEGILEANGIAGSNGYSIAVTSSSTAATVPGTVVIPPNWRGVSFKIGTTGVTASTTATVKATLNGVVKTATLTVLPAITSYTLSPVEFVGGGSSTGTVQIPLPAGSSGTTITLKSDNANATVPASVKVASGATSTNFTVTTKAVTANTTANISATSGALTKTIKTTILCPIASYDLTPASVTGGVTSDAYVRIPLPAGSSGVPMTVSSNTAAAVVPSSATVKSGATLGTFAIATKPVSTTTSATITVTVGGISKTAVLTIQPPILSVTLAPAGVIGSNSSVATVKLLTPAGSAGAPLTITSGSSLATVPPKITLGAGSSSGVFAIMTKQTATNTPVTITVSMGADSKVVTLNVLAGISAFSISPSSVVGGISSQGNVRIPVAAGSSGAVISVSSNSPLATVPKTVTVASGATLGSFPITTKKVTARTVVSITVSYKASTLTQEITLTP